MDITLGNYLAGNVTEQDVFDFVADNIIAQGKPSIEMDQTGEAKCKYNSADNCHCAAGWLLLDDPYVSALEGSNIREVAQKLYHANPMSGAVDFVTGLQTAHDMAAIDYDAKESVERIRTGAVFLNEFKREMQRVAKDYHLNSTSVA